MAECTRTDLEKNYEEKCQEISNLCYMMDGSMQQIGNSLWKSSEVIPPNNSYGAIHNYYSSSSLLSPSPSLLSPSPSLLSHPPPLLGPPSPYTYYNNFNLNREIASAHSNSLSYYNTNPKAFTYDCVPNIRTFDKPQICSTDDTNNGQEFSKPKFIGPHIYSTGTGFDADFVPDSSLQLPSYSGKLLGNKFGGFNKNLAKKSTNRKYSKYMSSTNELSTIDVTPEMLGITNRVDSSFLNLITIFRHMSFYVMELSNVRISLENTIKGYNSMVNYYLPTVISNMSNHLKMIHQSLDYEFFEIWKLIDSLEELHFEKINEGNVRNQFQVNLNELIQFENIKIRQKNGEILLNNEKISKLETSLNNLIECVRYYSILMTVMQYKWEKIHKSNKNISKDANNELYKHDIENINTTGKEIEENRLTRRIRRAPGC